MDQSTGMIRDAICPICGWDIIKEVVKIHNMPVYCHLLWPTKAEALKVSRGDIVLGYCAKCGHIYNYAFDPKLMDYTQTYENSLHFSTTFQAYAESLAKRLVDQFHLYNKTILEVGCGRGDFLSLICGLGNNRGYGFDPSFNPDLERDQLSEKIKLVQDYFSKKHEHIHADLVIARHVLEHIPNPRAFLKDFNYLTTEPTSARIFIEVPNALFILREIGIWDIIYEHCSYFNQLSLSYLLQQSGFAKIDSYEAYGGQFLCVEAEYRTSEDGDVVAAEQRGLAKLSHLIESFAEHYNTKVELWKTRLNQMAETGQHIVLWGSGSKGVTFLNTFNVQDQIHYIVDINPRKQFNFVAGTGQQIVPPSFLKKFRPDTVLILNSQYYDEIKCNLGDLDLNAELLLV